MHSRLITSVATERLVPLAIYKQEVRIRVHKRSSEGPTPSLRFHLAKPFQCIGPGGSENFSQQGADIVGWIRT